MFDESDQQAAAEGPPDPALMADFVTQYPHIVQIAAAATAGERSDGGHGCDEQFEFALDLLLDGAERLRRSAWSSADRAR